MAVSMPQSVCHKPFGVSVVVARVSGSCFVWLLPLVECTRPWFGGGGWWLVRGGSCWPDLSHAHQQHVTAASTHLHPVGAFHRGGGTLGGLRACCRRAAPPLSVCLQSAVH